MNIGLDMMGGDYAPLEAVKGIAQFLATPQGNISITLIGDKEKTEALLQEYNVPLANLQIIHAEQMIEMHEHPTKALKEKQKSSIAIGFHLLATGKIDAFISAGNTGAMMVGALFSIKAIVGVSRPTIGAYMPRENGS